MISIVIPAFNQHDLTLDCINVIRETTRDFELIVVDNGSTPPIQVPFMGFADATVIRNETNLGFPAAVNQGVRAAKGDVIVLLNNDVVVTPGWAERLLRGLETYSVVGPMTNYCAGMQCMTMSAYQDYGELCRAVEMWGNEHEGETVEVNWVIGFMMAFPRALYEELGPFDESIWPCSGEEIDFCYRARAAGHRIGIVCDAYVHHIGSVTFKEMGVDYEEICRKNDAHLAEKWGKDFWSRQAVSVESTPVPPDGLCLNLGCGLKHVAGFVNIDNRPEVEPDLLCDVLLGLPYAESSVDYVRAFDFLEHVPLGKTARVVDEVWRVLKPGGTFESLTPDAEHGQGAFQDPHHLSFWVENSWLYYSNKEARELYDTRANFDVEFQRIESPGRIFHLHVFAKAIK